MLLYETPDLKPFLSHEPLEGSFLTGCSRHSPGQSPHPGGGREVCCSSQYPLGKLPQACAHLASLHIQVPGAAGGSGSLPFFTILQGSSGKLPMVAARAGFGWGGFGFRTHSREASHSSPGQSPHPGPRGSWGVGGSALLPGPALAATPPPCLQARLHLVKLRQSSAARCHGPCAPKKHQANDFAFSLARHRGQLLHRIAVGCPVCMR